MATEEDVRHIAMSLPGVVERRTYGNRPSWKVADKGFVGIWKDDQSAVFLAEDAAEKEALLTGEPQKFFTTDHYGQSRRLLVRLNAVASDELRELITESWRQVAPTDLISKLDPPGV